MADELLRTDLPGVVWIQPGYLYPIWFTGDVGMQERVAYVPQSALTAERERSARLEAVFGYIRDALRHDKRCFANDTDFAEWAQSWARHVTQVDRTARAASPRTPARDKLENAHAQELLEDGGHGSAAAAVACVICNPPAQKEPT